MKSKHNHGGRRHNGRKAKIAAQHAANRRRQKAHPNGNCLLRANGKLKPGHKTRNGIVQAQRTLPKGGW